MCPSEVYTLAVINSSLIGLKGKTTIPIPRSGNLAKYPGLSEVMDLGGECKTTKPEESITESLMFILILTDKSSSQLSSRRLLFAIGETHYGQP